MIRPKMIAPRFSALLACCAAALAGAGCGASSEGSAAGDSAGADQRAIVRDAARMTLADPTSAISGRTATPRGGSFTTNGLVELAAGRFRVAVEARPAERGSGAPKQVIGLAGEGFETTVEVLRGRFGPPRPKGPCWFNPHAPVGSFLGTISVEESMRVVGAVVESLGEGELADAETVADANYAVELTRSATRPRDDFKDRARRIWGDRDLLSKLSGPITVAVDADGRLASLELTVRRYKPYQALRPAPKRIENTSIEASLRSSDRGLRISQPNCQAIE